MNDDRQLSYDIVVIGGGIAGMTAGLTSARLGRSILILIGGMLGGHLLSINKIEGYPGFPDGVAGYELVPNLQAEVIGAGASLEMGSVEAVAQNNEHWHLTCGEQVIDARSVIIATGTLPKTLGVPGEAAFAGKGVSHCASCDAPLMRDQPVVVVGGGDSAMQEALTLADSAAEVTILQYGDALTGQSSFTDRVAAHDKINVRYGMTVEEIRGEQTVSAVRVRTGNDGTVSELTTAGVFVYVGHCPNSSIVADIVQLPASGHIPTDKNMCTPRQGLFAAGSVRAGAGFRAITSAGDGSTAAVSADRYLSETKSI